MRTFDPIAFAAVVDFVNLRGVGMDAIFHVPQQRVVLPRSFPELVSDFQIFLSPAIALVVLR